MSYDLQLYLPRPIALTPPKADAGGNFSVGTACLCEDEDIPAAYLPLLGKRRRWLVPIHIEGRPAAERLKAFDDWLAGIVSETYGMLIDEQAGNYLSAKTSGPLPGNAADDDTTELGEMSFYFEDVETFVPRALPVILGVIRDTLPEAMPARFGQVEPLQGKVEDGDIAALLAAFSADPDQFMKARAPFGHIYTNIASSAALANWHPNHFIRRHFLAGRLSFELRPKALTDPRLPDLMWRIARVLPAFYAEIRETGCPVRAWFWRGLPDGRVRARVVGPPYTALWPEIAPHVTARDGDLCLLTPTRLVPDFPDPPAHLRQPAVDDFAPTAVRPLDYPATFPFRVPGLR